MRVGWIWGLGETQLPFPVHCAKERYHIYTDGKGTWKSTASVQHIMCMEGDFFKDQNWEKGFYLFFLIGFSFLQSACSWSTMSCFTLQLGINRTIMVLLMMLRTISSDFKLTIRTYVHLFDRASPCTFPLRLNLLKLSCEYERQSFLLQSVSICLLR